MLILTFVTLALCIFASVGANPAPLAKENPKNIVAVADFPESGPNKFTKGYVYFTSPKGDSVKVHVDMTGLPTSGGPFVYHIHEGQIFDKKSCDEAGKHFDPFKGLPKCPEKGDDAFCMVGDLSGKHGWINATCFQTEYHDKFLSLNPASESYIVGRSLVFHDQKLSRFACANINLANAEQYRYLFGAPGKTTGGHNENQNTNHPSPNNPAPVIPNPPKANEPAAPNPAPNPAPPTPITTPSATPVPAPVKASDVPASKPGKSTVTTTSTAGSIVKPTSSMKPGKAEAGNRFLDKATDSVVSPAVLLSSDATSSSFFRGLIGTVFGILLGIFF
ncbi:hypothetical protein HF325_004905 [Metschnikowia pulcherrima]|uniref:Superoxide dismutase copper/zinc binding domain-containing protein n=1 Tax=Metschnikowia pulcherrima TaxID=27326 RepID=A0A8H7GRF5_9ASCO|nr:hypothetical protein HF325_004905 [Metschnikowia pulcherrima]